MNNRQLTSILVADHEDNWRDLLALVIRRCGYEALEVKTGPAAVERAIFCSPSLILLELALPELSGREVLVRLQRNPATQNIPIFFQVPEVNAQDICRPDGVSEFLYKPFDLGDLPGLLRKYLPVPRSRVTIGAPKTGLLR